MDSSRKYNHLFLEGDSESGKSTMLREMLQPYEKWLGGFLCQRLLDDSGRKVAYRIVKADELCNGADTRYDAGLNGIFLDFNGNKVRKSQRLFEERAGEYILGNQISGKKNLKRIILMDEIGGFELVSERFFRIIKKALSMGYICGYGCQAESDTVVCTPCIGVIKSEKNLQSMIDGGAVPPECMTLNRRLRSIIEENNGIIIEYQRQREEQIKSQIKSFLSDTVKDMEKYYE